MVAVSLLASAACGGESADLSRTAGTTGSSGTGSPGSAGSPGADGVSGEARGAAAAQPFTVVAAGDIAWTCKASSTSCAHRKTAARTAALAPSHVIALGDNQYTDGTLDQYRAYYNGTWGRFNPIVHPVPGNHEYNASATAAGYRTYFGSRATPSGRTWYAWNKGNWHFVALDSNLSLASGSEQLKWLNADLAANKRRCVAAYFHHPRFSSGRHGNQSTVAEAWKALYRYRADLVLGGHDHSYERFALQDPSGKATSAGIREVVVGTGGAPGYAFATVRPNSAKRLTGVYAVLALRFGDAGYSGRLVRTDGKVVDSFGPTFCH